MEEDYAFFSHFAVPCLLLNFCPSCSAKKIAVRKKFQKKCAELEKIWKMFYLLAGRGMHGS
jgi:hypothetical protein